MTHQSAAYLVHTPIEAGRQVAQLRHLLRLVEDIAGRGYDPREGDAALDESARVSSAYGTAYPLVQRRFDALAAETAGWSAAAVEALTGAGGTRLQAPARLIADELSVALSRLSALLRL